MARGIDDVDLELVLGVVGLTVPEAGGSSGLDGDTTFLLLRHEVHGGGAVVGLADLVVLTGVEQNTLGSGGLAGINVAMMPILRTSWRSEISSAIFFLSFTQGE